MPGAEVAQTGRAGASQTYDIIPAARPERAIAGNVTSICFSLPRIDFTGQFTRNSHLTHAYLPLSTIAHAPATVNKSSDPLPQCFGLKKDGGGFGCWRGQHPLPPPNRSTAEERVSCVRMLRRAPQNSCSLPQPSFCTFSPRQNGRGVSAPTLLVSYPPTGDATHLRQPNRRAPSPTLCRAPRPCVAAR